MQLTPAPRGKRTTIYSKFVVVVLAVLCKVVMTVQLRKYIQTRTPSITADSPAIWPERSIAPVLLAVEDSVHYGIHTPNSDAEWSSLAPNHGLIYLGDEHQAYSISMFHELRCLDIIRQGIAQGMAGNVTVSAQLMQHCSNYLRQMIFCRSNTMLTGFVQSSDAQKPHSFLNIQRCNDWAEIYREVERNQGDHQKWVARDE